MEVKTKLTTTEVYSIIRENGGDTEHLLKILHELQNASGLNYIDKETAEIVAKEVGLPATRVYDIIRLRYLNAQPFRLEYIIML